MSEANGLPIGWALMSITDFCAKRPNAIKRGPFGSTLKKQFFVPTGIKVYEQQHAIQNDCSLGRYYIDETKFEELKAFEVRPGDLIVSCSGTIGKIAVIPEWADIGIINQALLKLTLDRDVVTNAYFKLLFEFFATRIVNDESRGSGMQNLAGVKEIKAIRFPIPPRPEQDRIVGKIEELFSDLEAGVAALRRARGNLKRYRASVLKAAVEGTLTAEWRATQAHSPRRGEGRGEGIEPASKLLARILTERRRQWEADQLAKFAAAGKQPPKHWQAKYPEPAPPDTTNLPTLPDGWSVASLEQLTCAVRPICYGILMPKENVADGVLYVKVKDMKGDRIHLAGLHRTRHDIAAAFARASLKFGDLLLAIRGTYGRVAEVPPELNGGNITQDTARLAVANEMDTAFVATALRASLCQTFFKRVARGVAVKGVNIGDVRQCPIPIPPLNEQAEIVATVSEKLSQIEAAEVAIEHSLRQAARLRQSILKQAFEGKLVPQDPTDEPASSLLERIRRERDGQAQSAVEPRKRRAKA